MAKKVLTESEQKLEKAIRAVRRKRFDIARALLADVVEADPQNERAWAWLARASTDPAQRRESLQRVLAINPNNQWAADELSAQPAPAVTPEQQSVPAATPSATGNFADPQQPAYELNSLECPNCGAACTLRGGRATLAMICPYCRSSIDLGRGAPQVMDQKKRRMKPGQPIEPGAEATFDGKRYQVIGWLRYEGWDDEDKWRWDEWQMISEDGDIRWLSYDDEAGFAFGKQVQPTKAFDPKDAKNFTVNGDKISVRERYPARVIGLAGELTWRAKVDNTLQVAEGSRGDMNYTVEYVPSKRLEIYATQKQNARHVWEAFGRTDLLQEAETLQARKGRAKTLGVLCAAFALLAFILAPILAAAGEEIYSGTMRIPLGVENYRETETFTIENIGRATKIELESAQIPVNTWAVVDITLYDDEDFEYYIGAEEFWHETGRDSDGPWEEDDLSGYKLFRATTPGTYQLELAMEESSGVSEIMLDVKVIHNVWLVRYLIFAGLVSVLLACIFVWNIRGKTSRGSNARLID